MLINANSLAPFPLADNSVQCAITSPPYWGLRDYGVAGQLGLEPVPDCLGWATGAPCGECYVCHMVAVFREVRRVLRPDGVAWCNLGDSYASQGGPIKEGGDFNAIMGGKAEWQDYNRSRKAPAGIKPKDLIGIPWRVAFALQADGWWLRSDIIWAKPNPMPESVVDRPTKSHEYLFLLAKSARYYYDAEAVKEPSDPKSAERYEYEFSGRGIGQKVTPGDETGHRTAPLGKREYTPGRNRRTVWTIATQPYAGSHFATFPEKLVEPCLLAGSSERGACPHCGAPWARATEYGRVTSTGGSKTGARASNLKTVSVAGQSAENAYNTGEFVAREKITTGWSPTCACPPHEPRPCVVLDPFSGSGTTGVVARRHGRRFVGLDLNATYLRDLALPRAEGLQTAASIATLPLFAQELNL